MWHWFRTYCLTGTNTTLLFELLWFLYFTQYFSSVLTFAGFFFRLSSLDVALILGNLEEICTFQQMLVQSLEECTKLVPPSHATTAAEAVHYHNMNRLKSITGKLSEKPNWCCSKAFFRYKDTTVLSYFRHQDFVCYYWRWCLMFFSSGYQRTSKGWEASSLTSCPRWGLFTTATAPTTPLQSMCSHSIGIPIRYLMRICSLSAFFCLCILFWINIFWLNWCISRKSYKPTWTETMSEWYWRAFHSWSICLASVNIVDRHGCNWEIWKCFSRFKSDLYVCRSSSDNLAVLGILSVWFQKD